MPPGLRVDVDGGTSGGIDGSVWKRACRLRVLGCRRVDVCGSGTRPGLVRRRVAIHGRPIARPVATPCATRMGQFFHCRPPPLQPTPPGLCTKTPHATSRVVFFGGVTRLQIQLQFQNEHWGTVCLEKPAHQCQRARHCAGSGHLAQRSSAIWGTHWFGLSGICRHGESGTSLCPKVPPLPFGAAGAGTAPQQKSFPRRCSSGGAPHHI